MLLSELLNKSSSEVRNSASLLDYFIEAYKNYFGRKPSCSGCAVKSEFSTLQNAFNRGQITDYEIQIQEVMEANKTFKLKKQHQNDIFTYKVNGIPKRRKGSLLDDDFVKELIKYDSKFESYFDELPKEKLVKKEEEKVEEIEVVEEIQASKPKSKKKSK